MTGKCRELSDAIKRRSSNIACVQEVKWTGGKAVGMGEGYKLFDNGGRLKNYERFETDEGMKNPTETKDSVPATKRATTTSLFLKPRARPCQHAF